MFAYWVGGLALYILLGVFWLAISLKWLPGFKVDDNTARIYFFFWPVLVTCWLVFLAVHWGQEGLGVPEAQIIQETQVVMEQLATQD